jgi:hypothetical protein
LSLIANLNFPEPCQHIVAPGEKARGDSYIWHIRMAQLGLVVNGMPEFFDVALAEIAFSLSGPVRACRLKD